MNEASREETYEIEWGEAKEWEDVEKDAREHALYAFYGHHHLYGRDVLLYIGRSDKMSRRLVAHGSWVRDEYDPVRVRQAKVFRHTLDSWKRGAESNHRAEETSKEVLKWIEALLIYAHQPAYNSQNKSRRIRDEIPLIRLFNTGKPGQLFPEVSSTYHCG